MSIYQKMMQFGSRFTKAHHLFRLGFNLSPMYRRSTARLTHVSPDFSEVRMRLPISYKNRNYANTIFGGSMFAAVDPIPMVQLINILGPSYIVWDKSAEIYFRRPAREDLFAIFYFTPEELADIRSKVAQQNEIEFVKVTQLTNQAQDTVYCEVRKTIYIAQKSFYQQKKKQKS